MSPTSRLQTFWQSARRLPRNIWVLTLASFLTDVSTEMIVHLLPLFLANILGVRTLTIGLIEGVAETTSSLLKLVSGRLSSPLPCPNRSNVTCSSSFSSPWATPPMPFSFCGRSRWV